MKEPLEWEEIFIEVCSIVLVILTLVGIGYLGYLVVFKGIWN